MAEVTLEMLQALMQRALGDIADLRKQMGLMNGRMSLMDRRINTILNTVRAGGDIAADLQNQIDILTERLDRLEHSPGE